ncbi:MAG: hypothetical protein EAX96_10725 [Candidatus Lokiarchaeota archaeon]|nr:hypothetical protein [Candidatus Lokiarchaeota archaeon]
MSEKIEKKRLPEQSATGKSVFVFSILTSIFYFVAGGVILPFPDMAASTFTFQFDHITMAILNFICGIGLILSAIPIHKRNYYLGSACILGVSVFGFVIGGGFLVSPLWGLASAMIGFITNPLECKLYDRKMAKTADQT